MVSRLSVTRGFAAIGKRVAWLTLAVATPGARAEAPARPLASGSSVPAPKPAATAMVLSSLGGGGTVAGTAIGVVAFVGAAAHDALGAWNEPP